MLHHPQEKAGIKIYQLTSPTEANQFAYTLLKDATNKQTLLLLGGEPALLPLYKLISSFETLIPGAVALTNELFGAPFHYKSNEAKINETSILEHFSQKGVPFFRILSRAASAKGTTRLYDNHLKLLFDEYPQKVTLLSLEETKQLAGIFPNTSNWSNPAFQKEVTNLVTTYEGEAKKKDTHSHITLTLHALSHTDTFIVLALGENKKPLIRKFFRFDKRQLRRFPLVFLQNREEVDVHLITDQAFRL